MLKQIPKNISPELMKALMEMGHGDEIILADGNYPAVSHAQRVIRCDGLGISELLESILTLLPLDSYSTYAIGLMEVVEGDDIVPVIWETYKEIIAHSTAENRQIEQLSRSAFYQRGKEAYAIVATGEEAIYGNILLKKGIVK